MKQKLLLSAFSLFGIVGFAQLSVKPPASGSNQETFIYVKNEVLYVNKDIFLTRNTVNQKEASIYLRGTAQLIQDQSPGTNSGNGTISVMQKTNPTNAYAYYDWGPMVGHAEGIEPGVNNFGFQNIYEPLSGEWGREAKPAGSTSDLNGTVSPFRISTQFLYQQNEPGTEALANYTPLDINNYDVEPGYGFTMKGVGSGNPSHEQWYEFRGRPHTGTFPVWVDSPVEGNPKMTMVANPYPSILDLNWLFHDSQNGALGAFYFYDEDRNALSHYYSQKPYGFGTWVPNTPVRDNGTNPGIYTAAPFSIWNADGSNTGGGHGTGSSSGDRRWAAIGQGFRIVGMADLPNPTQVLIKNEHRRMFRSHNFHMFKGLPTDFEELSAEESQRVYSSRRAMLATMNNYTPSHMRLFVTFDNNVTRDLLLSFSEYATDGFDRGLDALRLGEMASDASFAVMQNSQRVPFVINGIRYDEGKRVPLSLKLNKRTRVNFKVAEEVNPPYEKAYLYDVETGVYRQLDTHVLRGVKLELPAGDYEDRFYIVFEKLDIIPWKSADGFTFKENVKLFQNNPLQQLEIINPERYEIKSLSVFDMSGKLVLSKNDLGDSATHNFYTGNLSDGVYIVKMTTADDIQVDYKTVIQNK